MFPNLNCLMGCEGVSAGRAQAPGDVGEIVQSACLSHLLAASVEMLSKTGVCRRAGGAGELSLGMCQCPALLTQGLPGSNLPEPSSAHEGPILHRSVSTQKRVVAARGHAGCAAQGWLVLETCKEMLGCAQGSLGLVVACAGGQQLAAPTKPCWPQGQPCPSCLWCYTL